MYFLYIIFLNPHLIEIIDEYRLVDEGVKI